MRRAKQSRFANNYLQSQVEDNYTRFVVSTYVLGALGFLFLFRNIYYQVNQLNLEFGQQYFVIWLSLMILSVIFGFVLPQVKRSQNLERIDLCMMCYVTLVCLIAASITAIESMKTPNFTAFSFAVLGAVTAYRASEKKHIIIMSIATLQFALMYFVVFGRPFSAFFLLPVLAICVLSFLIASSLENNRKRLLELSIDLEATNERLKSESIQDPLTKLYNRRYLTDFLQREVQEFARSDETFCLAVCDLDHFKKINDNLGHLVGDEALLATAELLKQSSRATDILVRFGGEEFVIVMPRTSIAAAINVVERMRLRVAQQEYNNIPWPLTASFGLTVVKPNDTDISLIARADQLLYQAKEEGRNRTVTDSDLIAFEELKSQVI